MLRTFFLTVIGILFLIGCGRTDLGPAPVADDYPAEIYDWMDERIASLTAPTGWLRLAGMYWLEEGENRFGSGEDMDVRFPAGTIPEFAGIFVLEPGSVVMKAADGVVITHDGDPVQEMVIYDGEETPELEHESLQWLVITRDELTGIRLYNKANPRADQFSGFPRYDIDPSWHLKARFIPNPEGATIPVVNVMGQQMDISSPGILEFTIDGKRYTLDALENSTRMFIIVGDETNRTETYQAGRYMYIDYPEKGSDYTVIDFNKAYNPPCAYSKFTTCQLPPPQNRLDVAIAAGEKRPVDWDGL